MPRDKRRLKKTKEAKANREHVRKWRERNGEAAKEYNRAMAKLAYYREKAERAKLRLVRDREEGEAKETTHQGVLGE